MFDSLFTPIFSSVSGITVGDFLICIGVALVLGVVAAFAYAFRGAYTRSFLSTLVLLPPIVAVVIMMVGGNLGTGVAVAGTFSLVRFRSVPGTAREVCAIFLTVAIGLACGMGFPGLAALFAVLMCAAFVALSAVNFGGRKNGQLRKVLKITVPEDLEYEGMFREVFSQYTQEANLVGVKTTNLGSLNRLTYEVVMKKADTDKAFIDELRCRNGNLEISLTLQMQDSRDL